MKEIKKSILGRDDLLGRIQFEVWTDAPDAKDAFFPCWNNWDEERTKEWNVEDGDFPTMERYLVKMGLVPDLLLCTKHIQQRLGRLLSGRGIDLAAGNLWAVPYLFQELLVEHLYCLEYSLHRLGRLGPLVLEHYEVPLDQVTLVYGSFYNLNLEDEALDFVFMSQAFHHAERPLELLAEVNRVLKRNGTVIIIGEHQILTENTPPTDPVLGDHWYKLQQYKEMFEAIGFSFEHLIRQQQHLDYQSFILTKS